MTSTTDNTVQERAVVAVAHELDKLRALGLISEHARAREATADKNDPLPPDMTVDQWVALRACYLDTAAHALNVLMMGEKRAVEMLSPSLVWWGEESERISVSGHVDLALFARAARLAIRRDLAIPAGDPLEAIVQTPRHVWFAPLTIEYAREHYKRVTPQVAEQLVATGEHWQPAEPGDPAAEPWTVADVEWLS